MIGSMKDLDNVQILVITSNQKVKANPKPTTLDDMNVTKDDTVFLLDGGTLILCSLIDHRLEQLDQATSAEVWAETVDAHPWISTWAGVEPV